MSTAAPSRVPATREEFLASYAGGYHRWAVHYQLSRHWTVNWKTRSWECPGFIMCFGSGEEASGGPCGTTGKAPAVVATAQLLWFTPLPYSAVEGVWYPQRLAGAVLNDLIERLDALPSGLRPEEVTVVVASEGKPSTHLALGILPSSDALFRAFEERVASLSFGGGSTVQVQRSPSRRLHVPQRSVDDATEWCASHVVDRDATVECRPVPGWRRFLEVLYGSCDRQTDPQATTTAGVDRALRLAHAALQSTAELCRVGGRTLPSAAESGGLRRPSAFVATTLSSTTSAQPPSWTHLAVVQQSSSALRRTLSDDGVVGGPVQPATTFPVLHLHADAGDVAFAHKALMLDAVPPESYDAVLHSVDGEVAVSLGGVEGVAFDDLDVLVEWCAERHAGSHPLGATLDFLLSDLDHDVGGRNTSQCRPSPLSSSCCPYVVVPHVAQRVPTAIVARRTPFESPCVLVGTQDCSKELADAALAALEWLLACVEPVGGDGSSRSSTVLQWTGPSPRPLHVADDALGCAWCDRRRSKLPSCGACKTAVYCCKVHQGLHWKGAHKKECAWMREGHTRYDQEVRLLCTDVSDKSSKNIGTPESSAVHCTVTALVKLFTTLTTLCEQQKPHRENTALLLHVVNFCGDSTRFLSNLSSAANFDRIFLAVVPRGFREVKMIVFVSSTSSISSDACAADYHGVYEVQRGGAVRARPSTGVVGDYWRESSPAQPTTLHTPRSTERSDQELPAQHHEAEKEMQAADQPVILVVFSFEKYHNAVLPVDCDDTPVAHARGGALANPDLVVVLGDSHGTGMTFFSGVAEAIAQKMAGAVPVVATDASWVAAHRSLEAVMLRTQNATESSSGLRLKRQTAALHKLKNEVRVELNVEGFDRIPKPAALAHSRTPLHDHLYWWWLLPYA